MQRDNEKILQLSAEGIQQIRQTAIALLEAGGDFQYVMDLLAAAQVLQRAANMLLERETLTGPAQRAVPNGSVYVDHRC